MISDMYSIMKRINEIRNRFGLGSKNVSGKVTGTDSKISFEKMKNDAISSLKSGVEKNSITKTVSGVKSLNPSELYSEKNRISASLLKSVLNTNVSGKLTGTEETDTGLSGFLGGKKLSPEKIIETITGDSKGISTGLPRSQIIRAYSENKTVAGDKK